MHTTTRLMLNRTEVNADTHAVGSLSPRLPCRTRTQTVVAASHANQRFATRCAVQAYCIVVVFADRDMKEDTPPRTPTKHAQSERDKDRDGFAPPGVDSSSSSNGKLPTTPHRHSLLSSPAIAAARMCVVVCGVTALFAPSPNAMCQCKPRRTSGHSTTSLSTMKNRPRRRPSQTKCCLQELQLGELCHVGKHANTNTNSYTRTYTHTYTHRYINITTTTTQPTAIMREAVDNTPRSIKELTEQIRRLRPNNRGVRAGTAKGLCLVGVLTPPTESNALAQVCIVCGANLVS